MQQLQLLSVRQSCGERHGYVISDTGPVTISSRSGASIQHQHNYVPANCKEAVCMGQTRRCATALTYYVVGPSIAVKQIIMSSGASASRIPTPASGRVLLPSSSCLYFYDRKWTARHTSTRTATDHAAVSRRNRTSKEHHKVHKGHKAVHVGLCVLYVYFVVSFFLLQRQGMSRCAALGHVPKS